MGIEMLLLISGLVLFLGAHALPIAQGARTRLTASLGDNGYKLAFTAASVLGLVLIVWGYGAARGTVPLWFPPAWTKHIAYLLMLAAIILLVAAYVPSRIRDKAKHPMLAATKLWALSHLLVRGDLASVLLFGGFLVWAIIDRVSVKRRNALGPLGARTGTASGDAIVLIVGLLIYGFMIVAGHYWIAGVPLLTMRFAP